MQVRELQKNVCQVYLEQSKNEIVDGLPKKVWQDIFKQLFSEKEGSSLCFVSKKWKEIFDRKHPFKMFQNQKVSNLPVSLFSFTPLKSLLEVRKCVEDRIEKEIQCCEKSSKEEAFILQNIWFSVFKCDITSSNQEIQNLLRICKNLDIKTYSPQINFKHIIQHLSKQESLRIKFLPESIIEEAIALSYLNLKEIPDNLRTEKICLKAVKQTGWVLCFVPKNLRTRDICLEAVKQDGDALKSVPEELKTEDLCLEAVKQKGEAFKYVPENIKTKKVCLEAVKQKGEALRYLPKDLRIEELYLEAVKQDGESLRYIPKDLITKKVCLEAVKQDGEAIRHVPENIKAEELYLEAVKQEGLAIRYIPEKSRIKEVCLEAVKQYKKAIEFVPEDLRTEASLLESLK